MDNFNHHLRMTVKLQNQDNQDHSVPEQHSYWQGTHLPIYPLFKKSVSADIQIQFYIIYIQYCVLKESPKTINEQLSFKYHCICMASFQQLWFCIMYFCCRHNYMLALPHYLPCTEVYLATTIQVDRIFIHLLICFNYIIVQVEVKLHKGASSFKAQKLEILWLPSTPQCKAGNVAILAYS